MHPATMTPRERWRHALKPASWPKLLVPALLGQAIGVAAAGRLGPGALLFGLLFTVADLAFIVLLNDWGDQAVDALKRERFPDACSPKTIPDRILPARLVLRVGLAAGALALLTALAAAPLLDRPLLALAGPLALALFVAYTLPPLRLNYRGGGELLELLGVGLLLPWINAYAQCGALWAPPMTALLGFAPLALASALASGLADEETDRLGGKRTFTTRHGNPTARRACELLVFLGATSWLALALLEPRALPWWGAAPACALAIHHLRRMLDVSARATTNAFAALRHYKAHLHRAIWSSAAALALALLLCAL